MWPYPPGDQETDMWHFQSFRFFRKISLLFLSKSTTSVVGYPQAVMQQHFEAFCISGHNGHEKSKTPQEGQLPTVGQPRDIARQTELATRYHQSLTYSFSRDRRNKREYAVAYLVGIIPSFSR